ncbi:tRNA (adenosine(37)-N6)-dimethylallyltransferase MiaA [Kamptonema cortianum]|nr:tRNA (adenosine(37)-N6)-dimethylallyltransferase MiaA [Kamptonema cortianum]
MFNADAFQVYKGLDIGTNKPVDRTNYRLLDLVEPTQLFGVGEWIRHAIPILNSEFENRRHVIVCGGTGFYMRALFEEYADMHAQPNEELRVRLMEEEESHGLPHLVSRLRELAPQMAETVDLANPVRVRRALEKTMDPQTQITVELPPFRQLKIGVEIQREDLWLRISKRTDLMLGSGWVEEVKGLKLAGVPESAPGFRAIGYQSILSFLEGEISLSEAREAIVTQTRQYAKRQVTWMRSEPRLQMVQGDEDSPTKSALVSVWELVQQMLA